MLRKYLFVALLLVLSVSFAFEVNADELTSQYLLGRWAIGPTKQKCSDKEAEYLIFRKNKTFETGLQDKAETVGFWKMGKEVLELHLVTSPAFFEYKHKELKSLKDFFQYLHVKVVGFNIKKDSFEAIAVSDGDIRKRVLVRCK